MQQNEHLSLCGRERLTAQLVEIDSGSNIE